MTAIDFTSCPRIPVRAYNGANFHALVDAAPYLTPLQRQFYLEYLTRRCQIMFH